MGKLWLIGDSFFTRCQEIEYASGVSIQGQKHPGTSWPELFAKHLGLTPEYYWAYGSLSNQSILLGLDCVYNEPRFNVNTDKVLCGFTATSRQMVQGHPQAPKFDRTRGLLNEVEGSITGTSYLDHKQMMFAVSDLRPNTATVLHGSKDRARQVRQYYETLYPIEFDEYMQCMTIDGAITRAKQRGIDIIPHIGFMDSANWNTDGSVRGAFDWHNFQMFTAPCYSLVYKEELTHEQQFSNYSNHMSPSSAKYYGELFAEWYDKLG